MSCLSFQDYGQNRPEKCVQKSENESARSLLFLSADQTLLVLQKKNRSKPKLSRENIAPTLKTDVYLIINISVWSAMIVWYVKQIFNKGTVWQMYIVTQPIDVTRNLVLVIMVWLFPTACLEMSPQIICFQKKFCLAYNPIPQMKQ